MVKTERDIILILGDGGMMGVFAAGVMSVLYEKLGNRIDSIYGTSSGADAGVYFASNQPHIPLRFFTEYLLEPDFIRKNFLIYVCKIFLFPNSKKVKDYINLDYVTDVAQRSGSKLDLGTLEKSEIAFYVKVIDIHSGAAVYLPANKKDVLDKLKATSQCGPLSTKSVEIEGIKYIDGGTLPSRLDVDLVRRYKDKQFIFVQSQGDGYISKALLYPLYLLAGQAISRLYGRHLGKRYARGLFTSQTPALASHSNVIIIKNDLCYSSFCTDKKKLESVYARGIAKAGSIVAAL